MNDPVLQDIKDRLNIADVISGYIQLKKAGVNFKAPCPFHHEKSPSLVISPQKQIWHCFGCGEGGDVFGFVMKYENLEFKDALKILSDKAGVKLPTFRPENPAAVDEKELLYRINDFASRYYNKVLFSPVGKIALDYLKQRGLNEATINRWQIGYAPEDFHSLEKALAQKKVNINDLVKAGVSAKNERGQMYDRFRGRITFPIYNYFGQCVGFSARILNDDGKSVLNHSAKASGSGQAKYVNSPETNIYQKSKTLFGLNFAKEAIRKADEAVIVEGQMDCIASHQAGVNNVVASSGTALTEAGLIQLGRLTKNLKFCFDADGAGQTAARRAGELALKNGFKLKLIILTGAKDPDELIKKSPGLWQKAISEAVWFLDNYINYATTNFVQGSVDQKHYLSTQVVPFLGYIQDALEQDHYIKQLASKFLISEKVILDQIKKQGSESRNQKLEIESPSITNGPLLLQKEVLGGLILFPNFYAETGEEVMPEDFEDQAITELIKSSAGAKIDQSSVLAKEAIFMVESQLEELNGNNNLLVKQLLKSFCFLKANALKKQQLELQNQIKGAELAGNKLKVDELSRQFALVSSRKQKLEKTF